MTAVKRKFISLLACMAALLAVLAFATSCESDAGEFKVTFMVEDENSSEWQQATELTSENGVVELPTVSKQYYTFANWYENKDFTGSPFTGNNVTKNTTVYARFVPIEVEVHVNGVSQGTQLLKDVASGAYTYNPGDGLELDSWYVNDNYTTKWAALADANDLYARSVARITFNDGYQDVYTTTVVPGTIYETPATQEAKTESGETSTVERACIWRNYMSLRDISYVDENGEAFNFELPIQTATQITVKWRSPFLKYQTNPTTGNLCVTMYGSEGTYDENDSKLYARMGTVPVMSILGEITFDKDGNGVAETYKVEAVRLENDILNSSSVKKMIIGEGIVSIQSLLASASSVEEIVLPSSLKVLLNSFNNLNKLTSITVPDGVEVIIGSFWANTYASHNGFGTYNKGEQYPFEIEIPDSVKNLSMVPNNLKFSHTKETAQAGDFYKDGNYIYKKAANGDLILVSDVTAGTSIVVPEGVKGIQVGTYFNRNLEYLTLPSTFSYVNYNEDVVNYPSVSFQYSTTILLFDAQYANEVKGHIAPPAYSIFSGMESITLLNIKQAGYPENLANSAFIGDPLGYGVLSEKYYEFCDSSSLIDKIAYTGESDTPSVTVKYINQLTGETYKATIVRAKGDTLTVEELLTAIDDEKGSALVTDYTARKLVLVSIKNFGETYDLNEQLTANVYLDVTCNYSVDGGYTATDNGDGTATISAYNEATATVAADGLTIVIIPEDVTVNGKSLKVTKIANEAFANIANLGYVILPASLKEVGEKAFFNCASLAMLDISSCKLETIGASAFEGTSLTYVTLALSNMKEIGAYAFKIETLKHFIVAEGEENRSMTAKTDLKAGEFFFAYEQIVLSYTSYYSAPVGIYQYVSKEAAKDGETDYTIWDVKFVASARAYNSNLMSCSINLGDISDTANIIRYEVMAGSYYYLTANSSIYFKSVSKIHANAFTNCEYVDEDEMEASLYYSPKYMGSEASRGCELKALIEEKSSIFENGWYEGYTEDGLGSIYMWTVR